MTDDVAGKVKAGSAKATGDERLDAEGRTDQAKASIKQAGRSKPPSAPDRIYAEGPPE
jgi:uncharacterized protein YjbJ (UPF0337 family)